MRKIATIMRKNGITTTMLSVLTGYSKDMISAVRNGKKDFSKPGWIAATKEINRILGTNYTIEELKEKE